jgi:hypothetical protein
VGIALGLAAGLIVNRAGKPEALRYAVAVGLIAGLAGGGVMGAVVARLTGRGV